MEVPMDFPVKVRDMVMGVGMGVGMGRVG